MKAVAASAIALTVALVNATATHGQAQRQAPPLQPRDAVSRALVDSIRSSPDAAVRNRLRDALIAFARRESDVRVLVTTLDHLRSVGVPVGDIALSRIEIARSTEDSAALFDIHDEAQVEATGVRLPGFWRRAPTVFSVVPPSRRTLRILAFGDFGSGTAEQLETAAAMRAAHARRPFTFGITLGDNIYERLPQTPTDPKWEERYEAPYGSMNVPIYASLGNHDWSPPDALAAGIARSTHSRTWRLPARYYTYTAGPAQFFVIDTEHFTPAQRHWLRHALRGSRARWKIVYGHFPIGNNNARVPDTYGLWGERELLPLIAGMADLYLAGHHHSMQHVNVEGIASFIIGGGGRRTNDVAPPSLRAHFARQTNGFAVLEITPSTITVQLKGMDGGDIYTTTLRK